MKIVVDKLPERTIECPYATKNYGSENPFFECNFGKPHKCNDPKNCKHFAELNSLLAR